MRQRRRDKGLAQCDAHDRESENFAWPRLTCHSADREPLSKPSIIRILAGRQRGDALCATYDPGSRPLRPLSASSDLTSGFEHQSPSDYHRLHHSSKRFPPSLSAASRVPGFHFNSVERAASVLHARRTPASPSKSSHAVTCRCTLAHEPSFLCLPGASFLSCSRHTLNPFTYQLYVYSPSLRWHAFETPLRYDCGPVTQQELTAT